MVKVARPVKHERNREIRLMFPIESFDQTRRRGEAQLRPPLPRIEGRQVERLALPSVIEIQMERAQFQRRLRN